MFKVSPATLLLLLFPLTVEQPLTMQLQAERLVHYFLSQHPGYMALYYSDVDTAFKLLKDDSSFMKIEWQVDAYRDSASRYSRVNFSRSDSFYNVYRQWNLRKDSFRMNYHPPPVGWLIIHHFQLDSKLWTDSFILDFQCRRILRIAEAIE